MGVDPPYVWADVWATENGGELLAPEMKKPPEGGVWYWCWLVLIKAS